MTQPAPEFLSFASFADFLLALGTSPQAWSEARSLVRKGELSRQLEAGGEPDRAASVAAILAMGEPLDLVLIRCQLLIPPGTIPLSWAGEPLDGETLKGVFLRVINGASEDADRLFLEYSLNGWFQKVFEEAGEGRAPEAMGFFRLAAGLGRSALRSLSLSQRTLVLYAVGVAGLPASPVGLFTLSPREKSLLLDVLNLPGFFSWAEQQGVIGAKPAALWRFVVEAFRLKADEPCRAFLERLGEQTERLGTVLAKESRISEELIRFLSGGSATSRVFAIMREHPQVFAVSLQELKTRFQLTSDSEWECFSRQFPAFLRLLERESLFRELVSPPLIEEVHRIGRQLLSDDRQLRDFLLKNPLEEIAGLIDRPESMWRRGKAGLRDWAMVRAFLQERGIPEPALIDTRTVKTMTALIDCLTAREKLRSEWTVLISPDGAWALLGFLAAGLALPIGLAVLPALLVFSWIILHFIRRKWARLRELRAQAAILREQLGSADAGRGRAP
jgi:hypothetical protein